MVSKTVARKKKRAGQEKAAKEGIEPVRVTAPTRGHLVCGKLMRMRHGLKKKRKYRIGTATAHDIYENQDRPLGDVNCDATKAALAEAARRRVAAAEQQQQPQQAPAEGAVLKTKKIVKRVVKKKVSR